MHLILFDIGVILHLLWVCILNRFFLKTWSDVKRLNTYALDGKQFIHEGPFFHGLISPVTIVHLYPDHFQEREAFN